MLVNSFCYNTANHDISLVIVLLCLKFETCENLVCIASVQVRSVTKRFEVYASLPFRECAVFLSNLSTSIIIQLYQ